MRADCYATGSHFSQVRCSVRRARTPSASRSTESSDVRFRREAGGWRLRHRTVLTGAGGGRIGTGSRLGRRGQKHDQYTIGCQHHMYSNVYMLRSLSKSETGCLLHDRCDHAMYSTILILISVTISYMLRVGIPQPCMQSIFVHVPSRGEYIYLRISPACVCIYKVCAFALT